MDREQILELSQRLLADMFMAERCLKCEKVLSEKFANEQEVIHSAFFELARQSFLYTGTIILCKAFEDIDKHNKPYSIDQILKWVECTLKMTKAQREQLAKLQNEYDSYETIERLKDQRDKFYAHNDKISPDDLMDRSGLTRLEKLELIHFAERALSFVIGICEGKPYCRIVDKDESTMRVGLVLNDLEQYHHVVTPWLWEQWKRSVEKCPTNDLN